jgi:hypothetical protein
MKLTEPPFVTASINISLSVAQVSGEDFSVLMSGMNDRLRADEMLFRGFSFDLWLHGRRAPA